MSNWELLGIDETSDVSEIKKAFAKKLKGCRPEDDAALYQQIRKAYECIIRQVKKSSKVSSVSNPVKSDESKVQKNIDISSVEKDRPETKSANANPQVLNKSDLKKVQKNLEDLSKNTIETKSRINKVDIEVELKNLEEGKSNADPKSQSPEIDFEELRRIQNELENNNAVSIEELFPPLPIFNIPQWACPYEFDPLRIYTFN